MGATVKELREQPGDVDRDVRRPDSDVVVRTPGCRGQGRKPADGPGGYVKGAGGGGGEGRAAGWWI